MCPKSSLFVSFCPRQVWNLSDPKYENNREYFQDTHGTSKGLRKYVMKSTSTL